MGENRQIQCTEIVHYLLHDVTKCTFHHSGLIQPAVRRFPCFKFLWQEYSVVRLGLLGKRVRADSFDGLWSVARVWKSNHQASLAWLSFTVPWAVNDASWSAQPMGYPLPGKKICKIRATELTGVSNFDVINVLEPLGWVNDTPKRRSVIRDQANLTFSLDFFLYRIP